MATCYWRGNCPPPRADWPVRLILDSPAWQTGYDLAMEWAHEKRKAANPFSPDQAEFYGFDEGERDAEKLNTTDRGDAWEDPRDTCTNEAKPPA